MSSVIRQPETTLNIIRSKSSIGIGEQKVLFVGQKTSDGSASGGSLQESIILDADISTRFGVRSLLSNMLRQARLLNQETQFDAIPLDDDGSAVSATAEIAFTGTATATGTFTFEIASSRRGSYSIDVSIGDTSTEIADALLAKINLDQFSPFTASSTTGTVTLTATNGGTTANDFLLRFTGAAAGVSVALTPWANGANDPSLTALFDVVGDERYQTIIYPGKFDDTVLTDFLNPRFNATNNVLDGVGVISRVDTLANLKANGESLNSQSVILEGYRQVSQSDFGGNHAREMLDVMSALFGAARSLRLTDGANLANVVVTSQGSRDLFGGISLATLPYFNTPFPQVDVPITGTFWSELEVSDLADSGVSVIGPNQSRQGVIANEVLTTNTTDSAGNPDNSYKFLNTVDASSVGREYQVVNLRRRYSQSRLTTGDVLAGRSIENEETIRAYILQLYSELASSAVYQSGDVAVQFFVENLDVVVTLNESAGLVEISERPPLVGQLRDIQGTIQVNFSVEA